MTNKHRILKNRVYDISYKTKINQSIFDLVVTLHHDVLTIINDHLLERPDTTTNFLKSIETDLKWSIGFLVNKISIPIQDKLMKKDQLTELESHNFDNLSQLCIQIEEVIDVISSAIESIKPQQKKRSVKSLLKTKEIDIETETIKVVLEGIKPYFDLREHEKLKRVLTGQKVEGKIIFIGNKNQLPELFKRLEYNDKIIRPIHKVELARWLMKYFTTKEGAYKLGVLKGQLSKVGAEVTKNRRLCLEIGHLTPNQQNERNERNQK